MTRHSTVSLVETELGSEEPICTQTQGGHKHSLIPTSSSAPITNPGAAFSNSTSYLAAYMANTGSSSVFSPWSSNDREAGCVSPTCGEVIWGQMPTHKDSCVPTVRPYHAISRECLYTITSSPWLLSLPFPSCSKLSPILFYLNSSPPAPEIWISSSWGFLLNRKVISPNLLLV